MTGQNYVTVRDSTTLIDQKATLLPVSATQITERQHNQTPPYFDPDNPGESWNTLSISGQPDLVINPRAFLVQSRLVDLADRFAAKGFEMGSMQAIGNLLTVWQCTPIEQLCLANPDLHCATLLADFLDELLNATTCQAGEGGAHA